MTTEVSTSNTARNLLLKIAESFDKHPELKYAAANARILAEPGKYSAVDIKACPEIATADRESEEPNNIVAWPEMSELLNREIYYDSVTNEVEDEYEVIGMRMAPDSEHRDYWIMFQF